MCPLPENIQETQHGISQILVVDDEPTLRLGFNYTLTSETTSVDTAENGRIAIEMLANRHYDLMILDLRMPEMDGIEVVKAVRAGGNSIPIILCSAGFTSQATLEAIRNGVVDFLIKPLKPVEIREAVQFLLNPKQEATTEPVETALQAVREGKPEEAIQILAHSKDLCQRGIIWLRILEAMKEIVHGTEATLLNEAIHKSLPLLAMSKQTI
ncbi:MAG: response regulator [Verrucomicrobiota bacterium]